MAWALSQVFSRASCVSSTVRSANDSMKAAWLQQGYELEFLGNSTFFPGLWGAALVFFSVNVWLLGIVVGDIKDRRIGRRKKTE